MYSIVYHVNLNLLDNYRVEGKGNLKTIIKINV